MECTKFKYCALTLCHYIGVALQSGTTPLLQRIMLPAFLVEVALYHSAPCDLPEDGAKALTKQLSSFSHALPMHIGVCVCVCVRAHTCMRENLLSKYIWQWRTVSVLQFCFPFGTVCVCVCVCGHMHIHAQEREKGRERNWMVAGLLKVMKNT
jgi:hypothetical protein